MPVLRAERPAGARPVGFRCTGRAGQVRAEVPKPRRTRAGVSRSNLRKNACQRRSMSSLVRPVADDHSQTGSGSWPPEPSSSGSTWRRTVSCSPAATSPPMTLTIDATPASRTRGESPSRGGYRAHGAERVERDRLSCFVHDCDPRRNRPSIVEGQRRHPVLGVRESERPGLLRCHVMDPKIRRGAGLASTLAALRLVRERSSRGRTVADSQSWSRRVSNLPGRITS